MKWIKNGDNNYRNNNTNGPEVEPKSIWKRVFGGVILCAMLVLATVTIWSAATGRLTDKTVDDFPATDGLIDEPVDEPTITKDKGPASDESPRPGEDLVYKGIDLDPYFLGNASVGGGPGIGSEPYEYPFTLAEVLEAKGKVPTLELLQENHVPYVYDEDGNEIALFAVIGVITDQDDVNFDELRLTDPCVASCEPIEVELPATIYLDEAGTAKFIMFNDSLYLVSGNEAENASVNRYDWQIFGAYATFVTLSDETIERVSGQTFGPNEGITYKPGEKPTVLN